MAQPYPTHKKKRKKKKPLTLKRILKKTGRFFVSLARRIARWLYYGIPSLLAAIGYGAQSAVAFVRRLPRKTQLIGGGVAGALTLVLVIAIVASPGSARQNPELPDTAEFGQAFAQTAETAADGTDQSSAFTVEDPYASTDGAQGGGDGAATTGTQNAETTGAEEPVFTGEVAEGDSSAIITTIQARLMELGYMDEDEPTEHFGPLTKSALVAFQKHNDLGSDGICGEQTYAMLMNEDAKVYVMQLGDAGVDVEGVQTRLYELGYMDNKANITGNFGEKTEVAAKLFQKKNDLTADGKVGNKTITMLYDEDVVSNAYSVGDEAPIIKQCQQKLYKLGYITSKTNVTGIFNNVTRSAIKAFQAANGLTRDGALGPQTRDLLLSNDAQEKSLQLGDSGPDVQNAQKRLVKLKYLSSSNATGYFGGITEDAVRAFQKRNGITVSGMLNSYTLKKLNSSSAKKAAAKSSSSSGSSSSGSSGSSSSSSSGSSGSSGGSVANIGDKTGAERMIAIAESKLGSTYVRGAKGPNTFDCSGFVYYCMKNAGLSASYMTSSAWSKTTRYPRISSASGLQRGDVIVFSGHVGIYLGNGRMIDASSTEGKVRTSSSVLSGNYWKKSFIAGYRIF